CCSVPSTSGCGAPRRCSSRTGSSTSSPSSATPCSSAAPTGSAEQWSQDALEHPVGQRLGSLRLRELVVRLVPPGEGERRPGRALAVREPEHVRGLGIERDPHGAGGLLIVLLALQVEAGDPLAVEPDR